MEYQRPDIIRVDKVCKVPPLHLIRPVTELGCGLGAGIQDGAVSLHGINNVMVDFHECPVFLFTLKQCKFCSLSLGDIDDDPPESRRFCPV